MLTKHELAFKSLNDYACSSVCVCVCVCVCMRACVRACVRVCVRVCTVVIHELQFIQCLKTNYKIIRLKMPRF